MKAKQLIEILKKCDPETTILIKSWSDRDDVRRQAEAKCGAFDKSESIVLTATYPEPFTP